MPSLTRSCLAACVMLTGALAAAAVAAEAPGYLVCISNERSGDVTILDGAERRVIAAVTVGKRPRGIHPGPDGKALYVALSGSPITGPPALDGKGNPILKSDDDEDADHSADGIGVVDLRALRFLRKLPAGRIQLNQ